VWGIPCTEIRAEWAAQRIQGLSLARAILPAPRSTAARPQIKTLINSSTIRGSGRARCGRRARTGSRSMGGKVLMRHRVTGIERGWRAVAVRGRGTPRASAVSRPTT
jgi:hypothetical protein